MLDYHAVFNEVFFQYLRDYSLISVETIRGGALVALVYSIQFKRGIDEPAFLEALRAINGNNKVALLAGPLPDHERIRQVAVLDVPTPEEAARMFEHSPAIETGRMKLEIYTWWADRSVFRRPRNPAYEGPTSGVKPMRFWYSLILDIGPRSANM